MSIFGHRWAWTDFIATLMDGSVRKGGVLDPQDDFASVQTNSTQVDPADAPTPVDSPAVLPYDKLANRCRVVDMRQLPRTGGGRARGTRKISNIDTLWLHQTAAVLTTPDRFRSVPAHRGVPILAQAVLLHPIRAYMYHGHGANSCSIGYEIACRAAGIEGNAKTFWRSKKEVKAGKRYEDIVHEASDDQIDVARMIMQYDIEETARQGGEIRYVGSHRQSSGQKISDPGQRLWVALGEWAITRFKLKRSREFGSGRQNPTAWTGIGREPYSWKVKGY